MSPMLARVAKAGIGILKISNKDSVIRNYSSETSSQEVKYTLLSVLAITMLPVSKDQTTFST